jgi:hypothetical protein
MDQSNQPIPNLPLGQLVTSALRTRLFLNGCIRYNTSEATHAVIQARFASCGQIIMLSSRGQTLLKSQSWEASLRIATVCT